MPRFSAVVDDHGKMPYWVRVVLGLVLGVVLGCMARYAELDWLVATLGKIGSLFVQLLKLVVPPFLFTAIVASTVALRGLANAARLAISTLLWFCVTALLAVGIGIGLGLLSAPGRGATVIDTGQEPRQGSWLDFLTGLIPANVIEAFAQGSTLQIVSLAVVTGAAAVAVGDRAQPFLSLNQAAFEIVQKVLWWLIWLSPLGTLGLIGHVTATVSPHVIESLGRYAVAVNVGSAIVLFIVYPVVLVAATRLNPLRFFHVTWPAMWHAFISRSSVAAMPVTLRAVERLGVPRDYASFAVPLGATTKMDGCAAISPAISAIFIAQVSDIELRPSDYLLIVFVSVVGSVATAGLNGAVVMLTLTAGVLDLPFAALGLLLAVDPLLDMVRTATNVGGQALVPTVVAVRAGILDASAYESAAADPLAPTSTIGSSHAVR
ncbi:dicarboxylate/amino acid:cation symporter [Streptomyces sp. NPDC059013]|uniref:dicarboxylate/amino acid:cation symporter n=1 Tax=unclassified Streptomyces TaxID=2593676 RepID=UPI0036B79601